MKVWLTSLKVYYSASTFTLTFLFKNGFFGNHAVTITKAENKAEEEKKSEDKAEQEIRLRIMRLFKEYTGCPGQTLVFLFLPGRPQ